MSDRIEFHQNPLPLLVVGLTALGGAIWMAGEWWGANWSLGNPSATVGQRYSPIAPNAARDTRNCCGLNRSIWSE